MNIFEPDFKKILKHLNNGDFNIAKSLHDEILKETISKIDDDDIIKQFKELSILSYKTGNWALERTIITSMMEAQKVSVLLSLNYLKIFGELEYVKVKFSSGPNPEVSPTSSLSISRRLSKELPDAFKGDFTEVKTGKTPKKILLGKYDESGNSLDPTSADKSGKKWFGKWDQYKSSSDYKDKQLFEINSQLEDFDDKQYKQDLLNERTKGLEDEYKELEKNSQLKKNHNSINSKVRKYFIPKNIKNDDDIIVFVDIESDYDIQAKKVSNYYLVVATLKKDLEYNQDPLIKKDGTKRFQPSTITGNSYTGLASYTTRLLPVLLKDGINTLVNLNSYISKINTITGEIITKRLINEFEFMDPDIANLDDKNELKNKYYSDNEMIFNGKTYLKNGNIDLQLIINKSLLTFKEKEKIEVNDNQMKFLNDILAFISIPMNMYSDMLESYKNFLIKLMNPSSVVSLHKEYSNMNWLKNIITEDKILQYLKTEDNSIYTTVLFTKDSRNWSKKQKEKQKNFYEELINIYIDQVSLTYGVNIDKIKL